MIVDSNSNIHIWAKRKLVISSYKNIVRNCRCKLFCLPDGVSVAYVSSVDVPSTETGENIEVHMGVTTRGISF